MRENSLLCQPCVLCSPFSERLLFTFAKKRKSKSTFGKPIHKRPCYGCLQKRTSDDSQKVLVLHNSASAIDDQKVSINQISSEKDEGNFFGSSRFPEKKISPNANMAGTRYLSSNTKIMASVPIMHLLYPAAMTF